MNYEEQRASGAKAKENNEIELTFVLPCLNEAGTVALCIEECLDTLSASEVSGEVVVADNGSTDASIEIASQAGARVVSVSQKGYGNALLGGIHAAKGKFVLMGDSDCSYHFGEMPRFLDRLRNGSDLVIGCRLPRGGGTIEPGAMPFLHRYLGNPALSMIGRILFRNDVVDFHCGIRAFRRKEILGLRLKSPGMEFATEMIVKASMAGLRMSQVPATLRRDRRGHPPHLRTWRDGCRHLSFMIQCYSREKRKLARKTQGEQERT